jgi:hypothetical protein
VCARSGSDRWELMIIVRIECALKSLLALIHIEVELAE